MDAFTSLFRAARAKRGLSQGQLARILGIRERDLARYEDGREKPSFDFGAKLLKAAGVELYVAEPVKWAASDVVPGIQVPEKLIALPPSVALRSVQLLVPGFFFSKPRSYNLADRQERIWAYQRILDDGDPKEIEATIDRVLLCEIWSKLDLTDNVRRAWAPLVEAAMAGSGS